MNKDEADKLLSIAKLHKVSITTKTDSNKTPYYIHLNGFYICLYMHADEWILQVKRKYYIRYYDCLKQLQDLLRDYSDAIKL